MFPKVAEEFALIGLKALLGVNLRIRKCERVSKIASAANSETNNTARIRTLRPSALISKDVFERRVKSQEIHIAPRIFGSGAKIFCLYSRKRVAPPPGG